MKESLTQFLALLAFVVVALVDKVTSQQQALQLCYRRVTTLDLAEKDFSALTAPTDVTPYLDISAVNQQACQAPDSCKDQCGFVRLRGNQQRCNCDAECIQYGDCCYDFEEICAVEMLPTDGNIGPAESSGDGGVVSPTSLIATEMAATQEQQQKSYLAQCLPTPGVGLTSQTFQMRGSYQVTKCSADWQDDNIRELCENPVHKHSVDQVQMNLPLSSGNFSYRNVYCAICNNVDMCTASVWSATIECPIEIAELQPADHHPLDILTYGIILKCRVLFANYDSKNVVRQCFTHTVHSCKDEAPTFLKMACSSYANYVRLGRHVFKNPHCALCNGVLLDTPAVDNQIEPFPIDNQPIYAPENAQQTHWYLRLDMDIPTLLANVDNEIINTAITC